MLLLEVLLFESGAFLVHKKSKLAAEGWLRGGFLVIGVRVVVAALETINCRH